MSLQKFHENNPVKPEEHLIVELTKNLDAALHTFLRNHDTHNKPFTNEIFIVVRDACINFSARTIRDLTKILYEDQHDYFIQETKEIFIAQLEDYKKTSGV